jgi:hypothetical protein
VVNGKLLCDPLTPLLPTLYLPFDRHQMTLLAKTLCAFKTCINELYGALYIGCVVMTVDWYDGRAALHLPPNNTDFPFVDQVKSLTGDELVSWTYESRLIPDKLLFRVRLPNQKPAIVKFTQLYSLEAHCYCAELVLAPRVLGFSSIFNNEWHVVLMDAVDATYVPAVSLDGAMRLKVYQAACAALERFHAGGFVHGDYRDCNLLWTKTAPLGDIHVWITDFDYAG